MKIFKREHLLERSYMKGKLVIKVWEVDNGYEGHITYRSKDSTMDWDMPGGLNDIYPMLFEHLEEDVAPVVYEEIEKRYNETLCIAQVNNGGEECHGQQFPYYKTFNLFKPKHKRIYPMVGASPISTQTRGNYDEYRRASDRYLTYGPNIIYISAEEYEKKKERGELNSGDLYLIINQ